MSANFANDSEQSPANITQNSSSKSAIINDLDKPDKTPNKRLLTVGRAKYSVSIQIPIAAFILVFCVTSLVSVLFYYETERLLAQQISNEIAIESDLVEPMFEQLYSQAYADILFLSQTPPIEGMLTSATEGDDSKYQMWKSRLEVSFSQYLANKPFYYQIRYIGVTNDGQELVNVRNDSHNIVMPSSRLQKKSKRSYFIDTINKDPGQVYFSKIELDRNFGEIELPHKAVLRVATPIYDAKTGHVFGLIIINLNFGDYIEHLKTKILSQLSFYISNNDGDFVAHPDNSKTFGFDLGRRYLIQDQFPLLSSIIQEDIKEFNLGKVDIENNKYVGHYQRMKLDSFDNTHQLNLLVLKDRIEMENSLTDYRLRSLVLGSALALISLAIAIIAARKIATPLQQITQSLESYEGSNQLTELPVNSNTEIGVLARSFSNLFNQMQFALQQQQHSALLAEQSTEQIKAIFSSAAEGFITINEQGVILSFNQAAQKMFGYSENDVINQNVSMLMPFEISEKHDDYLGDYKKTGVASIMGKGRKLKGQKKSGESFPIHLATSKVTNEQRVVFTGIVRDISKEEQLEVAQEKNQRDLIEVNNRISLAAEAASLGIWQYEIATDTLSWDKWMHKIYEISPQNFSGRLNAWKKIVHPDDIGRVDQTFTNAMVNKTDLDYEFRIITPSGSIKHIKTLALIKTNDLGDAIQLTGVNFDITERKTIEKEHVDAKELAEITVRHKAEFLASMSHEIRTPMNGILGMLGLLLRNELSEEQKHRVNLANSSAEALLSLIDDILDFSKVEAGKLELEVIDFDLRELFGEFTESLALRGQEKNIEIILDNRGIEHSHVKGDPGRIRQLLNNLTGNAIKFTDTGEIVITASLTEENDNLLLQCSVRDTGIGIPQEKISHLFQSFTQVDSSTTRKYGGTGLGLAICEQLCKLMQGDIHVSSVFGQGSTFSFTIKLIKSEQSSLVVPSVDIKNIPILIVDDNKTNRLVLKAQLEHWGAVVYEAESGLSALTLLETNVQDKKQDNIKMAFIDMYMPHIDGIGIGKNIKNNTQLKDIKLVMMTSMSARGDASYFKSLGFSACFPKPAITKDLFKTLHLCLSEDVDLSEDLPLPTTHSLTESKSLIRDNEDNEDNEYAAIENVDTFNTDITHSSNDFSQCRVLLVEDNRINQEVAYHILAEFNIIPDIAVNGLEALAQLKNAKGNQPYNIILMDCQMPEMDGYEATKAIRNGYAGDENKEVTIIAMTANAMKGDREKCLASGMTDYLSKPIEPAKIKEKLALYFNRPKIINNISTAKTQLEVPLKNPSSKAETSASTIGKAPLLSQSSKDTGETVSESDNSDNSEKLNVWERAAFSKRLNNNSVIQKKLIELFLEDTPKQLSELSNAIEQCDNKLQHDISHKIQGMSANLSAEELLQYTKDFNHYVKKGDPDQVKAKALFQAMKLGYKALETSLKKALTE